MRKEAYIYIDTQNTNLPKNMLAVTHKHIHIYLPMCIVYTLYLHNTVRFSFLQFAIKYYMLCKLHASMKTHCRKTHSAKTGSGKLVAAKTGSGEN